MNRERLVAILISLSATLPFLNKAYHIDDVLYLSVARQIIETPWSPFGDVQKSLVMWDSEDGRPASLFRTDYNPPLWKYLLAGTLAGWGDDEWKLHSVVAVVVLIAGLGIVRLAKQITGRVIWSVWMILLAPFFLPGQNCMLEPPLLCLTVWATSLLVSSWDRDRLGPALASGVLVGLAILTKYTAGLLLPVFMVGCLMRGRYRSLAFLAPAVGILALWCLHNIYFYGEPHLTAHGVLFQPGEWPAKARTVLRIIGGVSLFWPIWIVRLWRRGPAGRWTIAGLVLAGVALGWYDAGQVEIMSVTTMGVSVLGLQKGFVITFCALGFVTLFSIIAESVFEAAGDFRAWRSASIDRWLETWILALVVFNVACTPFNAVRHMLLAFVPMTILSARKIDGGLGRWPAVVAVISASLAFGLAAADYEFAGLYRRIAQTNIRQEIAAGKTVWYTGNWGFIFYAAKEGAKPVFFGTEDYGLGRMAVGDRVYHPVISNWRDLDPAGKVWAEHMQPQGTVPLRSIAIWTQYYGLGANSPLPWTILILPPMPQEGRDGYEFPPLDHIKVFDVVAPPTSPWPWKK